MTRRSIVIVFTILTTFAFASVAHAGNWATSSIDDAPDEFQAGKGYDVTYTVLQHGVTPVEGSTAIALRPAEGTEADVEELVFRGVPTDVPGQYRAHVEVPASGVWQWEVRQGVFGVFDLGSLTVAAEPGWSLGRIPTGVLVAAMLAVVLAGTLAVMRRAQTSPSSAPASRTTSSM
ncbi:MAG TPA: hypothetical protein VFO17_12880 [Acidimicrobiia bacterium]|jgi:hypothetical protein|nr:hypothetical protein [Acidimicrobiia bacterium]